MKTEKWNKDAITKEIIVVLNWFIHIEVFLVETFMQNNRDVHVKQNFLFCDTFQAVFSRLSDHITCVTIICVTKFKPEFQKYKARKCKTLYQRKRVKGRYFWKTSFWLYKLVIPTRFKNHMKYGTYVTCEIRLISTKHCFL